MHLNVKLVIVMGHEGCGAVKAARLSEQQLSAEPGQLRAQYTPPERKPEQSMRSRGGSECVEGRRRTPPLDPHA